MTLDFAAQLIVVLWGIATALLITVSGLDATPPHGQPR